MSGDLRAKNRIFALAVGTAALLMTGLSFASVPLYRLFCSVTGYGGTTQTAQAAPDDMAGGRIITVTFDSAVAGDLPWEFAPDQHEVRTTPGQKTLISYHAKNLTARPVTGTALYNVTPPKAGRYFRKIECFCFGEQTLEPGQQAAMPVLFFIDPAIADDPGMKDVTTITLSYTFYKAETPALERAVESFYNRPAAPPEKDGAS